MWNDGLDDGYHPWLDLSTRLRWKMSDGDTVVVIFPNRTTKNRYYRITSEEDLKTTMAILNQKGTECIIKIFDQKGNLTEEIKKKPELEECTMENVKVWLEETDEFEAMIDRMDQEIKHQQDLKKRREKRKQNKKGEKL